MPSNTAEIIIAARAKLDAMTPLPWTTEELGIDSGVINLPGGYRISYDDGEYAVFMPMSNATGIVAAVAAFGPLLGALEAALDGRTPHEFDDQGGGSCRHCVFAHRYGRSYPMDDPIHSVAVREAVAALTEAT